MAFEVLVVDDNDDCREIQAMILAEAGYAASEACNGLEAVERAGRAMPDLIIMDVHMPVMDGLTATKEILALAGSSRVTVIAQTADINALRNDQSLFYAILQKPAAPEEMLRIVAAALAVCAA